jgi:UDP-glucose 4-epimerase
VKYLVTGGAGFIGSHMVDRLVELGHNVFVVDNLLSGFREQVNTKAKFYPVDIRNEPFLAVMQNVKPDGVFHFAAIARTPWCIEDPVLAAEVNATGTIKVLEAARRAGVRRSVLSSSNVVYAAHTPYRVTKEMGEMWGRVYSELYGQSNISLRYSNAYGTRQSELGPSPNVFAAFRKCLKENGYVSVTGDGEQSRDFTHVSDIVEGNLAAMNSDYNGTLDLCTGKNWTMNEIVLNMFKAQIRYVEEREGDVKHITQNPEPAERILGWKSKVALPIGIKDCL